MQIAINKNLINKVSSDALKKNNSTFENVDVSINYLAELISYGFAFCAQHTCCNRLIAFWNDQATCLQTGHLNALRKPSNVQKPFQGGGDK